MDGPSRKCPLVCRQPRKSNGRPSIVWKTITGRWRELPRHIRVVLGVEAAIVAVGGSLFFILERSGLLAGWGSGSAGLTSIYMPLVGRTSGFQTTDLGSMGPAAAVLIMVLMLVGGSPASTAGGMKTTVLAAAWARLTARGGEPMLGGSPVGRAALGRAKWVAVGMLSIFAFTTVSLLLLEEGPVLPILFEATSASGTVGLSMGATPGLSLPGRVVVIIAMFCARIAPAALALSWSIRHPETPRDEHAILVC